MMRLYPGLYYYAGIGSCLLWTNLYLFLRAFNDRVSHEFTNRLVTVTHALVVSLASVITTVTDRFCLDQLAQPSSIVHSTIIVVSLGYFIFDIIWCLYTKSGESILMMAHHVISILAFLYVLQQGRYGCETVAVVAISELSNPLLQLRWFIKYFGVYGGSVAVLVNCMFALTFWFLRMVLGTILLIYFMQTPQADLFAQLCGATFYTISVVFSLQIAHFIIQQCSKIKLS